MTASEAEAAIRQWIGEYGHIDGDTFVPPEKWVRFAGLRMSQMIEALLPEDKRSDWNVVRAEVGGKMRDIRIDGRDPRLGRLRFGFAEAGSIGMGYCSVENIRDEDQSKLARILDKIEGTR